MDTLTVVGTLMDFVARLTKRSRKKEKPVVQVRYNGMLLDREAGLARARKLFDEGVDANGERPMDGLAELFVPMAEFSWWTNEVSSRFKEPIYDFLNRFVTETLQKASGARHVLDWLFWRIARHVRVWTRGDNQGSMLRMYLPASIVALHIAAWLDHPVWYAIIFSLPFLVLEALPMAAGSFVALAVFAAYCPRRVIWLALFPTWWLARWSKIPDVPTLKEIYQWWHYTAITQDGRETWARVRVFSKKEGEVGIISLLFDKSKKKQTQETVEPQASLAPPALAA